MQAHNIKILEAIAAAWGCGRGPAWLSPLQSPRKKKLLHEKMSALPASTSKKGEKSNAGSSLPILELLSSFPNNVTLWSFSLQNAPHEPFELLCSSLLLPKAFKNAPMLVLNLTQKATIKAAAGLLGKSLKCHGLCAAGALEVSGWVVHL